MMRLLFAICIAGAALVACAEPPATEPIARGRQVFRELNCASCHAISGEGGRLGPDLGRIGIVAGERRPGTPAEEYLRESLESPSAYVVPGYNDVMPRGLTRGLSATDVDALIAYLGTLR